MKLAKMIIWFSIILLITTSSIYLHESTHKTIAGYYGVDGEIICEWACLKEAKFIHKTPINLSNEVQLSMVQSQSIVEAFGYPMHILMWVIMFTGLILDIGRPRPIRIMSKKV